MMPSNRKQTLYIIGAQSSFISEAIELGELNGFSRIVCVDNLEEKKRYTIDGYPVVQISEIASVKDDGYYICCLHTPLYRNRIIKSLCFDYMNPISLIHPSAVVSKRATISKKGVILCAQVVVGSHSDIADYSIINRGALIGHDVMVNKFATIESGVILNGFCKIGEKSFIGSGAILFPYVSVGKSCIVGAGSVVKEDVPDCTMVAGVPAQVKRRYIQGYLGHTNNH